MHVYININKYKLTRHHYHQFSVCAVHLRIQVCPWGGTWFQTAQPTAVQ